MSIRMVAVELYRVMKQTEELEKKLRGLKTCSPERDEIERELRVAGAEKNRLHKMLEGAKGE